MTDTMDMLNQLPEFFTQLKTKLTLQEERIKQLEEQVEANDRIEERMIAIQTKERVKFEEEKMKWEKIEKKQELMIQDITELGKMKEDSIKILKNKIKLQIEINDKLHEKIEELSEELGSMEEKLEEYEDNFERVEEQEEIIESQKEIIEKLNKKLEKKKYNKKYQEEHKEKVAKKKKQTEPKKKAYLQKAELLVCPCLANQKKTTFRRDGKSGHLKSKVHQEWYLANPDWEEPEIWKGENSTLHTKTEEEINELYDIEKSKTPVRTSVSST